MGEGANCFAFLLFVAFGLSGMVCLLFLLLSLVGYVLWLWLFMYISTIFEVFTLQTTVSFTRTSLLKRDCGILQQPLDIRASMADDFNLYHALGKLSRLHIDILSYSPSPPHRKKAFKLHANFLLRRKFAWSNEVSKPVFWIKKIKLSVSLPDVIP